MARGAEIVGRDVEGAGAGQAVIGCSLGSVPIETRDTFITVESSGVVSAAQALSSDVITVCGMALAVAWFTHSFEHGAVNPSMTR